MAEFYQYTKLRKDFGKPVSFSDTKPMSTAFYPAQKQIIKGKDQTYVLRNPNFIQLDNITQLSYHQVNTKRVKMGQKGMLHREGGWPQTIDPTQPQQYARFMKKIDKDQSFAQQVKSLCQVAERTMLKNNQIDMFEQYFVNEESQHIVQNISTKTLMLFKDPPDICKRSVSQLSWHVEGPSKLAVSYAISRFQQTPQKMKNNSYVWDLQNPNTPEITLTSPSPLTNLCYNHKHTDLIGAGCGNGVVGIWDSRKGGDPVSLSHVQRSHNDPVTHFQWLMTKTGTQCVSVSTDGYAYFWDTRKLKEDRTQSLKITDFNSQGKEVHIGATTLQNSSEAATKYVIGTQQGTIVIANKRPRKQVQITSRLGQGDKHLGPIYSISRNMQFPKVYMSVGDWSAKLWMDDLKSPLIKTRYHNSYLSDGCFSPTRVGAFFLTRKDGWLDVWDYYYRQNQIAFSHKVSDAPLTSIKISSVGTGNQITGGRLCAIGDQDGTVTLLQLCESLYTMQKNQRDIMTEIFQRQMVKQKNLQALRKLAQIQKKRVPKDMTSINKKLQQRKREQIDKVQSRFAALLKDHKIQQSQEKQPQEEQNQENKERQNQPQE